MAIKSSVTTPLRAETFKKLQLNAGVMLTNFPLDDYQNASVLKTALSSAITAGTKLLGATRGGGTFVITRDMRQVEVDGMRANFKGSNIVDKGDAYMSTTLLEQTPEHLKAVIGNADIDDDSPNHVVMTVRLAIDESDYIDNIVWIGDTNEGFMAIELLNGLNTADVTFTWADKNEGTVTCEFHAHQEGVEYTDELPVKLHWFTDPAGASSGSGGSGGSGSGSGAT